MNKIIWYQTVLLVVIGLLVKRFPILMAGYNTMTAEQKKNVDAKGAADYLCRAFCIIALVGIILFYGLQLTGMTEKVITILTSTVVPVIGILITLVKIQKFDHTPKA
ncbi:DUF3784 domain-containing protein [Bacteroides clarus]|uniref:DUF3784 domain-containing protein n=1 Tax=Bacteroides clarus TaxID=626929 RepID=UPI003FF06B98